MIKCFPSFFMCVTRFGQSLGQQKWLRYGMGRNFPLLTLPLVIFGALGCQNFSISRSLATPPNSSSPLTQAQTPLQVEFFNPKPIQIQLKDLPRPFASRSAVKSPQVVAIPAQPVLQVPAGFQVNVFAENLKAPRWLALTPSGDVLVTETRENRIQLLQDTNQDGIANHRQRFAGPENGLDIPFGMAFTSNTFFLGNTASVLRFSYKRGQTRLMGKGETIAQLPGGGYNQHWTRNVVISPDQKKLFVSIGSRSNNDVEALPRASIQVMDLPSSTDPKRWGGKLKLFAHGLRNPVGLAFHPQTQALYATVNERDGLGDDLVPDYFTRVVPGGFYGWPFAYLSAKNLDPQHLERGKSRNPALVAQTLTPDVLFQAHSAALGLTFYQGKTFPPRYRNGAFVAFRGSWNRNQGTGYKLVFIPFNAKGEPQGYYEDFLKGFLVSSAGPTTWGRPVGLLSLPDGSLLFTEEANNRIYRVQYVGSKASKKA